MIIYMWNRKETIIPEKQTARKPEKNLGFTSKFASPGRTMLELSLRPLRKRSRSLPTTFDLDHNPSTGADSLASL